MKVYLLPHEGTFYKANLHCHSTISDGRWTPEEIKENYKRHGYSVVAYTDHAVFIRHNELADENFLPLNGYELDFAEEKTDWRSSKVCHLCFIALDKSKKTQKLFYQNKHLDKNFAIACLDAKSTYMQRQYAPEYISNVIEQGVADGFFVTYNHPSWSFETKEEYGRYRGMHAMEIVNYGCVVEGYEDHNGNVYDQMLRDGKRLYCIATDDNHDKYPIGHPRCDSFGGFTMIKANALCYSEIARALTDGHFYASEGPAIHELYFEDGKIFIETSDVERIVMITAKRRYRPATAEKAGETINRACFEISDELGDYVRFVIRDERGKEAYTNACFLSDLLDR